MPSITYSWYTCDTVDGGMLNACITSEREFLAPTRSPRAIIHAALP